MAITSHITVEMMLAEAQRIGRVMKKHYPKMVKQGKINPLQRDHRLRCNEKLIELLQMALKNKK